MNVSTGRKTFTRSDFSKSLRDLGLTPSAVSLSELLYVDLLYTTKYRCSSQRLDLPTQINE